nr:unnamed protein product [Callosobruchus analis]
MKMKGSENNQLVCHQLTTGSFFDKDETLDRTYEPSAVSCYSQDDYECDIISFSEETELEEAENNINCGRKRKTNSR